ncbi:putative T-complex protein 1, alpha subunit [Medicago truncatula]|uniref:T-complex protein 1 subunit alpha n=1 Tax=Medicago truncatula TaxID=3880 RepID=A0A396GB41_MEDTR|nr:putative T-complex protein 1, alpha subunit [Medicago truncatula]
MHRVKSDTQSRESIYSRHIVKVLDSFLMNGYALNTGRAAQGMPLRVSPAKIACLDFNLQKTKMQLGVQVLVSDPRELEKIRQREADMTKERIEKLLKAGANVVLTTKGIDDMALKAGAIAVRRVRKEDMRHVAKATGETLVSTFADMEGEETFEPSFLGTADEVVEECIADDAAIMIKGTKTSSTLVCFRCRVKLCFRKFRASCYEYDGELNFLLPCIFNSLENFSQGFNKPFESAVDNSPDEALLFEEENILIINRLHQVETIYKFLNFSASVFLTKRTLS